MVKLLSVVWKWNDCTGPRHCYPHFPNRFIKQWGQVTASLRHSDSDFLETVLESSSLFSQGGLLRWPALPAREGASAPRGSLLGCFLNSTLNGQRTHTANDSLTESHALLLVLKTASSPSSENDKPRKHTENQETKQSKKPEVL